MKLNLRRLAAASYAQRISFFVFIVSLMILLTVSLRTLAGPPKDLALGSAAPTEDTPKAIEIASRDGKASLPAQLFKALSLIDSDVLVKTGERISLKDPHSEFQLSCRGNEKTSVGYSCSIATPEPELGWTVSESSAQAVLFHALEALSKETPKNHKNLRIQRDEDEVVFRLGDSATSSSLSCTKRTEDSVQFSCRIRIRA
jgi:hypothetical protein